MAKIKIDPEKTYTKMAYHKETGHSRSTIDRNIKDKKLDTIKVKGAELIIKK